ncbi:hypothetical protein CC78DRAFT_584907 [Lojkania enalia]|uniref:Uncharacterized protein n=1 Tax=Lojkania enalia TaxID=147567 RepID=A0A9P4K1S2_9PLEO|nr:hypothetical protein CC78DRAFT_584907 [Didymosphaeria enalia]
MPAPMKELSSSTSVGGVHTVLTRPTQFWAPTWLWATVDGKIISHFELYDIEDPVGKHYLRGHFHPRARTRMDGVCHQLPLDTKGRLKKTTPKYAPDAQASLTMKSKPQGSTNGVHRDCWETFYFDTPIDPLLSLVYHLPLSSSNSYRTL